MKKTFILAISIILSNLLFGQASGNINYQNQTRYPEQNISVSNPSTSNILLSVKGLANIKADSYVAIFSVNQVGKTSQEVNDLIDKRIKQSVDEINKHKETEVFIDMISFVPIYEFEIEKKIFSKTNYNEIPKSFELKKNIHIKYHDQNQLNDFISILSNQDIYNLVRVDYFASNQDSIKKQLMNKSKQILQEKIKTYQSLLGISFDTLDKSLSDGYKVLFPVEMYKSFEAYNSSSLNEKKSQNINLADKSPTLYYQPIVNKEFDFVINPIITEPVIQIMYEIKLLINKEKTNKEINPQSKKEYILISPNGELKNINL